MTAYRDIQKINQSCLKQILKGPQQYQKALKKMEEPSTEEHFIFGDIVDLLITDDKDEIERKYFVMPDLNCSPIIRKIVEDVYNEVSFSGAKVSDLNYYRELILKYRQINEYDSRLKEDTAFDRIVEKGKGLFSLFKEVKGRIIISDANMAKARMAYLSLLTDEFTSPYLKKLSGDIEFLDKFVVEFKCLNTDMKGELDRVIINHTLKTITPADFKTTGKTVYDFQFDFWKYRYDFQGATYHTGLSLNSKIKNLMNKGYNLETFKYIVVEKDGINRPLVFNIPFDVHQIGLHGGMVKGYKYEGLIDAVERLEWHTKNEKWDYPVEYYEKKHLDILV